MSVLLWILICLAILAGLYLFLIAPGRDRPDASALMGWLYAHRGLHGGDVPENSLAAFSRAVEAGYGIELDEPHTRDGRLAAHHDASLKRVCGADLRICDITCEELCRHPLPDGSRVPLFSEVLSLTVAEASEVFANHPALKRRLALLDEVGLGYIRLGQSAPSLSGGESQRLKLATELARPSTGRTLFVLDEPTVGLHPADEAKLLKTLDRLVEAGNTVLVVEHDPRVIAFADRVVELGPEGGAAGGRIVAEGTPEEVAAGDTLSAPYLREILKEE